MPDIRDDHIEEKKQLITAFDINYRVILKMMLLVFIMPKD